MTDRLAVAVAELVGALRDELARQAAPTAGPVELVSVAEFARRAGIGRSTAYLAVADGSLRSVKVRGRRLVPCSEIDRLAAAAGPENVRTAPADGKPGAVREERRRARRTSTAA